MSEHTITSFGLQRFFEMLGHLHQFPRVEISTLDWRMNICTWLGRGIEIGGKVGICLIILLHLITLH